LEVRDWIELAANIMAPMKNPDISTPERARAMGKMTRA